MKMRAVSKGTIKNSHFHVSLSRGGRASVKRGRASRSGQSYARGSELKDDGSPLSAGTLRASRSIIRGRIKSRIIRAAEIAEM